MFKSTTIQILSTRESTEEVSKLFSEMCDCFGRPVHQSTAMGLSPTDQLSEVEVQRWSKKWQLIKGT